MTEHKYIPVILTTTMDDCSRQDVVGALCEHCGDYRQLPNGPTHKNPDKFRIGNMLQMEFDKIATFFQGIDLMVENIEPFWTPMPDPPMTGKPRPEPRRFRFIIEGRGKQ